MAESDWYRSGFFDTYSRHVGTRFSAEQTSGEVDWLIDRLALAPGSRLLDVCCGSGRHTVEFARRGIHAVGVDLNDAALELARERADEAGVAAEFRPSDMRELGCEAEFDAVVNLQTSFGYLESEEEDQKALNAMARALRPGGLFALDTVNLLGIAGHFRTKSWEELPGGVRLLTEDTYEPLTGRISGEWVLLRPDGEELRIAHRERAYLPVDFDRMARRGGLEPQGLAGSLTGGEWSLTSLRLVFLARRGGGE